MTYHYLPTLAIWACFIPKQPSQDLPGLFWNYDLGLGLAVDLPLVLWSGPLSCSLAVNGLDRTFVYCRSSSLAHGFRVPGG